MSLSIRRSCLEGTIVVPPSKSHTLRSLIFAFMAHGKSKIINPLHGKDTFSMLKVLSQLGALVAFEKENLWITGIGKMMPKVHEPIINAGNSGQILRFITPLVSLFDQEFTITGDESICSLRPVSDLLTSLQNQGVKVEYLDKQGHPPFKIKGPLKHGTFKLSGEDSQPVSGLLIATSFLESPSTIHVSYPGEIPWVDLTLAWLSKWQPFIQNENHQKYEIGGRLSIPPFSYQVPGDFSSAAFPIVCGVLSSKKLVIQNLDVEDSQGDKLIIDILRKMGACIRFEGSDIIIQASDKALKGIEIDVNNCIDALPILSVVCCFASSSSRLYNGKIARFKECDRINAIAKELKKMGANIEENDDGLTIHPSSLCCSSLLDSHDDHRIAMALVVAAMHAEGISCLEKVDCIQKSYPSFIRDFIHLGAKLSI